MIKLYGHELSGNSYKPKLLLSLLGIEHEWIKVDVTKGEQKSPEFLELNPFGQIPVLVDRDLVLADAQAILVYLARSYGDESWLPLDAVSLGKITRWLSTTAGEIRQGPESARLYYLFNAISIDIDRAHQKAEFILGQLNQHLSTRQWLEFERLTIADIAVFPYIAIAPDGKIDLSSYPHVLTWMNQIKQLPGYVPMINV